ncbi:MAG TPA: DUF885 family protein [Steroidobacteraceae bacterium]|nr:DUF885 family protein [Steroidobacteraceae bacterium]
MTRFSSKVALGLAFLGLAACGRAPPPAPSQAAKPAAPRERLSRIVDRYWDERMPPGIPLSRQFMADSLGLERRFLDEARAVPRDLLDADSKLTYDIFKRQRELDIEEFTYPDELLPVNPFESMPQQFARMAGDLMRSPPSAATDYGNWLLSIDDYVLWSRQAIANMREGMRRGYTSPRVLMERMLPLLQGLSADTPANPFYGPLRTMPATIKDPERTRLASNLQGAIKDKLLPAYRELHDFIRNEYLPRARLSVALSALPLGPSWYATLVKRATGSPLTPREIHGIGAAEVDRILARLQTLPAGAPPQPKAELLSAYQDLKVQAAAALPALFSAVPPQDFEIAATAPWETSAPLLAYQPAAANGRTPALLRVNTAPGGGRASAVDIANFLQEAIPGRHYQSALQQERVDLPKFRRFGTEPSFVEGWALYAASLGEELGLYRDAEAQRGELLAQLKCAAALAVDTGLHATGWTRAQAVDYLRARVAADEAEADLMTDRFVALPAQGLACKMGELKFRALLARAQQVLGTRFDIREFHYEILKDGAMPLDILEAKMQRWMEARSLRQAPAS